MVDDPAIRSPADAKLINLNQDHELRYWTHKFGCTVTDLRIAVRAVGPRARAVAEHLKASKSHVVANTKRRPSTCHSSRNNAVCGRYELHASPAALALALSLKYPPEIQARYNIAEASPRSGNYIPDRTSHF